MQPSATENGPYDYTRSGNPTRDALERSDFIWLYAVEVALKTLFFFFHNMFYCEFFFLYSQPFGKA